MFSRIFKAGLLAAIAMGAMGATTASAPAGSYHLYTCRTPAGEGAPADGWSGSKVGTYTYALDTCQQSGGALLAALGDQAARTANTDAATWAFSAPAGERITSATLWRAGDADGGAAINAFYEFWLAGPNDLNNPSNVFNQCVGGTTCQVGVGDASNPMSLENRVLIPGTNLGGQLFLNATCAGESGFKCKEGQGDPNNYAAVVYLFAADMTLEQSAGPTASNVSGELAGAPSVAGTSDVAFTATDPGAGVYAALFSLDGQLVQSTVLDEDGGRCRNVGQTTDGLPAFLYVQPCLGSLSSDVAFDTTRFPDGTHHLQVSVMDAAGNTAPVIDRNIVIANAAAGGSGSGGGSGTGGGAGAGGAGTGSAGGAGSAVGAGSAAPGPANGSNASAQASLTTAWKGSRSARLVSAYGRPETVVGRLTGPGGVPIVGAQIDALATPSSTGAATVSLASPRTGGDGGFTMRIPAGVSSRTLHFAYRSHLGDSLAVATRTLTLTIRAGVTLSISPRSAAVDRRIFFNGRLPGRPIPSSGKLLVLEARSGAGGWIKFDVVRSDRSGRYHASYRFRFPGPASYSFRVLAEAEADYPFAAGSSNSVIVRER